MSVARNSVKTVFTVQTILVAVLAGACGGRQAQAPRGPAEVGVRTLKAERYVISTKLPGRTSAYLVAEVRPQVSGIVQQRRFEEGADVKAGQLLYQIDPAQYQAAFEQANGALAIAEGSLPAARSRAQRFAELVKIHAVGQQDYDDASAALAQAEAGVTAAKAAVAAARINLEYTPIKAPITGRIGKSNVTVGSLAAAYQPVPLAVIQQLDPIYVDVTEASAEVLRMQRALQSGKVTTSDETGRKAKLFLEDGTPYPLEGTLKFRDVTVDPATGSVTLRMLFPNPGHVLLPGMFVRAVVEEGVDEKAILAPQQGVSRDVRGNPVALVVGQGEVVEQRALTLGPAVGDRWLVLAGLAEGDRLIVDGLQRVRPGATVSAVPAEQAAGGRPAESK